MGIEDGVAWSTPPTGLNSIAADLRAMRAAAGSPSYAAIGRRIEHRRAAAGLAEHEARIARSTVYDCFKDGRRRLDTTVVREIATVLGLPPEADERWAARISAARAAADGASVVSSAAATPPPVPTFVGRAAELAEIESALAGGGRVWLSGMAGVGKTQLVLRLADALPSGAVHLDLRAHDTSPPVEIGAAQRAILRRLGAAEGGRESTAQRARRVSRALRESGRVLILDDAPDLAVVEAVGVTDRVVVTSRRRLPGGHGWHDLVLHGFDASDTDRLLHAMTDERHAAFDSTVVERLTAAADGLPLELALVGARLRTHRDWTLTDHTDLAERRVRDARLDAEVGTSIALSADDLTPDAFRLLRLVADGPTIGADVSALAALAGTSPERARALASELVEHSLATWHGEAIVLHALVRAFARERAWDLDAPRIRSDAFRRLGAHLAETVWAAYETIARDRLGAPVRRTAFRWTPLDWTSDEAYRWMTEHIASALAVAYEAPGRGAPDILYRVSEGASIWMNLSGRVADGLRLHGAAADVAAEQGDAEALAMASLDVGQLLVMENRPDEAFDHFLRAAAGCGPHTDRLSDPGLVGVILNMSAVIRARRGETEAALDDLARAVDLHERLAEPPRHQAALLNRGHVLRTAGRFADARAHADLALAEATRSGSALNEAHALIDRGAARLGTGDAAGALVDADHGARLAAEVESPYYLIEADATAADALVALARPSEARARIDRAVALADVQDSDFSQAGVRIVEAAVSVALGDTDRARDALGVAHRHLEADLDHDLWGRLWQLRGELTDDEEEARAHRRRSSEAFERAGRHETGEPLLRPVDGAHHGPAPGRIGRTAATG